MYCPAHFQEDNIAELIRLMEQHPLATVVGQTPAGLVAEHVPLMHVPVTGSQGRLIGHVAKSNPLWQCPPNQELLLVFQGPSAYVSPNWYASKAEAGKVVPTWNYAVVHVHCTLTAIHDPDQVMRIISDLTDVHEASQAHPWRVSDAPIEFTQRLLAHIVGIELNIVRMQGKWKVSQNQPAQNQASLIQALEAQASGSASEMATLIATRGSR